MASCYDFCGTAWYRMAPGALYDLKQVTFGFGRRYLIVTGCGVVTEEAVARIKASFDEPAASHARTFTNPVGKRGGVYNTLPKTDIDAEKLEYRFLDREGVQVTLENARQLRDEILAYGADVVVAVGGGKVLDLVRAASHFIDSYFRPRIVLCPTLLASNAPATSLCVIYNADGCGMEDLWAMQIMPDAVLVDTEFIIQAPVRAFVAGIGDQLGTYYEGIHALEQDYKNWDTVDRMSRCYLETNGQIVLEFAREAVESVKRKEITHAFEHVVNCVSFETGPLGQMCNGYLAHIMDEMLLEFAPCRKLFHGERVAYGALAELSNLGRQAELEPLAALYRDIGLPCTLDDLGIPEVTYEHLLEAAKRANGRTMARLTLHKFTPEEMAQSVLDTQRWMEANLPSLK